MTIAFDTYLVKVTLLRDMLGTNPSDPNVHDTHILSRQRKIILEKGGVNAQINKYLDQIQISKDKGDAEVQKLIEKLEKLMGYEFSEEDKTKIIRGELESLKETFQEMDIKGVTVFFWDKEKDLPCIGDHMIYGFLKAAAEAIGRTLPKKNGTVLNSCSYTQSLINQHVRCDRQFITASINLKLNADGTIHFHQRSLRAMTAQGPRVSLAKSEVIPAGAAFEFGLKVLKNSGITKEVLQTLFSYGEMSGLGQWRNAGFGQFKYELT